MRFVFFVPVSVIVSVGLLQGCVAMPSEFEMLRSRPEVLATAPGPFSAVSKSIELMPPPLVRETVGVNVADDELATSAPENTQPETDIADNAPAAPDGFVVTSESPSDLVSRIQKNLSRHGFETGVPDGVIGPRTRNAIRAYQEFHSVRVTGEPTSGLLDLLLSE